MFIWPVRISFGIACADDIGDWQEYAAYDQEDISLIWSARGGGMDREGFYGKFSYQRDRLSCNLQAEWDSPPV